MAEGMWIYKYIWKYSSNKIAIELNLLSRLRSIITGIGGQNHPFTELKFIIIWSKTKDPFISHPPYSQCLHFKGRSLFLIWYQSGRLNTYRRKENRFPDAAASSSRNTHCRGLAAKTPLLSAERWARGLEKASFVWRMRNIYQKEQRYQVQGGNLSDVARWIPLFPTQSHS